MKNISRILMAFALFGSMFVAANAQDLKGDWKLAEAKMNGEKIVYKEEIHTTLSFFESDKMGGNSGCNRYSTSFTLDGGKIELFPVVSTKMACEGERMKQEEVFFGVIEKTDRFRFEGQYLIFTDEAGKNVLKFVPRVETKPKPVVEIKKCRDYKLSQK